MALENNFFVKNINLAYCKPYLHHNGFIYCIYYRANSNVVRNIPAKVVKIDTNYNLIWAKQIDNLHFINQIIPGTTGNLIIYGGRYGETDNTPKAVALKMSDAGVIRWSKEYDVETDNYTDFNVDRTMIQGISSNRYVFIARQAVCIINDNGTMLRSVNMGYIEPNNFNVFSGMTVHNDRIFLAGTGRFTGFTFAITELNTNLEIVNRDRYRNLSPIQTGGGVGHYHVYPKDDLLFVSYSPNGRRLLSSLTLNGSLESQKTVLVEGLGANSSSQSNKLEFTNSNFYFNHKEFSSSITNYYKFDFNLNCLWTKRNSIAINAEQFQAFDNFIFLQEGNRNIIKTDAELEGNDCVEAFEQVANPTINEINIEKQPINDVRASVTQVSTTDLGLVAAVYNPNIVQICPTLDIEQSTITANPNAIPADGDSTSTVTVQLKDANGSNITSGGEIVIISTSAGAVGATIDNNDGTYTAVLQSTNVEEAATLSFTVNGTQAPQTAPVEFYISSDCYFTSSFRTNGLADVNTSVCSIGANNILTVGSNGTYGIVTLFNANSSVVWSKQLAIQGRKVSLTSVVTCNDGQSALVLGNYGTGATNRVHLVLFRINAQGTILWSKILYSTNTRFGTGIRKLNETNGGQKYLVTAWYNEVALQDDMELYKLDENGNISASRKVAGISDEQIMEVVTTPFGFSILGSATTPAGQTVRHGIVLSFRDNLSLNWGKRLGDGTLLYTTGAISITSPLETYILAGIQDNSNKLYLTYFNSSSNSSSVKTTNLGNAGDKLSTNTRLVRGAGNTFYCVANYATDRASEVIKFDFELNEIWRQKLDFGSKNGINQLVNDANQQLLLVGSVSGTDSAYLAKTNLELKNCISEAITTTPYTHTSFTTDTFAPTIAELAYTEENVAIAVSDIALERTDYCSENCGTTSIPITEHTAIQSPNFYIQAAGSTGNDGSVEGIHTRWVFSGALGEKHLPKGNYANTSVNFNKQDDFVRVYRTPYAKVSKTIDLTQAPNIVDDANGLWIYRVDEKDFHVYFRNQAKYTQVRSAINPVTNAQGFMQSYGSELVEVESKRHLFFAVEATVSSSASNSSLQTETLSVSTNTLIALKKATNRKTFSGNTLQNVRLLCENGRSFRSIGTNTYLTKVRVELYGDFIENANENQAWTAMGSYALTLEDGVALQQLEPTAGIVNAKWPRFNDDATVNIDNYVDKWNVVEPDIYDRNLKQVVEQYITLSDDANNPKAIEEIPVDENIVVEGEDDVMEISNLDMLNIASYDYHMARMLGLGFLDVASQVQQGEFVYIAEYVTFGDLEDGQGAREVQHLSMSLPTATSDERLPLPISLEPIVPGAFFGTETSEPSSITDDDGYTHDGKKRYVTLYAEEIPEDVYNPPFYVTNSEFEAKEYTIPIYAGLEYRKRPETQVLPGPWEKPEISHDKRYLHIDSTVSNASQRYEAFPITLPEVGQPIFVHKQIVSGRHYYGSYGINWFSRATSSLTEVSIVTEMKPVNPLLPPSNIQPLLVQKEQPLLLTSQEEQDRYDAIIDDHGQNADQTLVRISFDYHSYQELVDYAVPTDSVITDSELVTDTTSIFDDDDEIFAEDVDIFFRNEIPNNISGQVINVEDDPTNNLVSIITVDEYYLSSVDQTLTPDIPNGLEQNYAGGVFVLGEQQHIIHEVVQTSGYPQFKVYKKEISDALVDDVPSPDADSLQAIEITGDGIFLAIENMQTPASWGTPNPQPLQVTVNQFDQIHREVVMVEGDNGELERHLEKTRGIWSDPTNNHTTITEVDEVIDLDTNGNPIMGHKGMYNITFHGIVLDQHVQYSENSDSVEWYRGIVRIHTTDNPNGKRKVLKVAKILNIKNVGDTTESDVQVLAFDPIFSEDASYDPIQIGTNVSVNFYPGYKVYLYENQTYGLTEVNLLPGDDEEVRNSIVGLRSHDTNNPYYSSISIPKIMFAQKIVEAKQPEQPDGAKYATRPDFFGRSTYTLTTKYAHKPHGVLFYRTNDEAILNALYEKETVREIRSELKALGGSDEDYFANRWENFLDFTTLSSEGDYRTYPPVAVDPDNNYKFPNPDKVALFEWANDIIERINSNTAFPPAQTVTPFVADPNATDTDVGNVAVGDPRLLGFIRGVIYNAFVPLTKVPVVYAYINGSNYKPINKKQVLRDENGSVLLPTDPAFEMAPMMKVTSSSPHTTQFTDFNLDGTSNNIYFYAARELSSQMKLGEFSDALGPIKLVQSNAPEAPEVKRIMPVLEDQAQGIEPKIQLEINAYPEIQKIKKVNIYRAFNKLDAQSIRTMTLVDSVDVETAGLEGNELWTVYDNFTDLDEIPYGDGLFYRVTVSRRIEYSEADYGTNTPDIITEYAPSQASKIVASMMVEVANPPAPTMKYIAEPIAANGDVNEIALQWEKTCYKGKYIVYKMNTQGNWEKIHEITTNETDIFVLLADTTLQDGTLATQDDNGNPIYHHFKVVAQNTSGMLSTEDNIMTLPNEDNWIDIGGIGDMVIGTTFTVR
ncbi:Ig-like domain-containing protein [Kordia sp.]|uniref:Ig-like domain-containing protein n=1 Tax=Kordia sp. TaxID=1965332 RepID=UPI003B5975DC